jgi:cytochrome b
MDQKSFSTVTSSAVFIQDHSVMIRIWHWILFLLISATMITVLLNSTIMNQRKNIVVVQEQLKLKGVAVTEDQAFAVSCEYEDKIWGVHKWIGYSLAFLLLSRGLIEITLKGEEKLRSRILNAIGLYRKNNENRQEYKHYLGVKLAYLLFFVLLFCMALTGLSLAFEQELGFSRAFRGTIEELHSFGQYFMYAFVLIHIIGVVIAENNKTKGIVSGMINGNR